MWCRLAARTVLSARAPHFGRLFRAGLSGVSCLPSTVFPTGAGLPLGVQVVAKRIADHATMEFARLMTERLGGLEPPWKYGG